MNKKRRMMANARASDLEPLLFEGSGFQSSESDPFGGNFEITENPFETNSRHLAGRIPLKTVSDVELRARTRGAGKSGENILGIGFSENTTGNNYSIIERKIQEGETLQKISLQYSVPVSELKRVNGLISDQDFYGISFVKIPVMKYSHVQESLLNSPVQDGPHSSDMPHVVAEDAVSETSDFVPLSDSEFPLEERSNPEVPATKNSNNSVGDLPNFRESQESLCSDEDKSRFVKLLKNVDANLEKAKGVADRLEQREGELREEIFNASNGETGEMYHLPGSYWNNSVDKNIRHYVIVVLIVLAFIFVILVPIGYVLHQAVKKF